MDKKKPTFAIYGIQDRHNKGYPFFVHDHNMAIMEKGRIVRYLHLERYTRHKRDNSLHIRLKHLLKEQKLLGEDFDLIFVDNVVGRTFLTQDGEVRFEAPLNKALSTGPEKGRCWWFGQEKTGYALSHELAHLFSCLPFFGPFRENSLLVHFDGGASLSNFSAAVYKNGSFRWVEYHWELKPYSTVFNANALVFALLGANQEDQNAVPGKFMGFAGWGTPGPTLQKWLEKHQYFQDIWDKRSLFFRQAKADFGIDLQSFDQKNPFLRDVAATLQEVFIQQVVKKMEQLAGETGTDYLYYTGGSALNIVANTRIIGSGIFREVFIPPCTGDCGLAIGAAAFAEWKKHGEVAVHSPYLNNWGIEGSPVSYTTSVVQQVARKLAEGNVTGVCNGFGEAGPRALGNRSLLALAGSKKLANEVSMIKKGREWYRPLAPVALRKNAIYFTGEDSINPLSKYMLVDFMVRPDRREEIAGAVHADGTARFQTIFERTDNPFLYDLLTVLDKNYGIKALINTSFNRKGEPIVHTPADAQDAARRMNLDALVINGKIHSPLKG